ncbi:MAG TPA: proline dehydrogenase family protein, partial [Steroidobacteraceae bacterium]|nr:proline dehydrogenase family protein [Steroidobacteraceae bacterium]
MSATGVPGGASTLPGPGLAALRTQLREATLRPEAGASTELIADLTAVQAALARARARAARWVEVARADQRSRPLVDRMLEQFPLDSAQGRALMSLAEALLRTPDARRADQLIAERLAAIRDAGVRGDTDLLLRTGFTLLSAAGRLLPEVSAELSGEVSAASLTKPVVAPIVRAALRQSMQTLGHAFIVGETIDAALKRARSEPDLALCSFDMLGEGARTSADAGRYFDAYAGAIDAIGRSAGNAELPKRPGISVKLSALHPRYEALSRDRVLKELTPRLLELARLAKSHELNFTVDAEEADRLELSLDVIAGVLR